VRLKAMIMIIYTTRESYPVQLKTGYITRDGSKDFSGGWKFVSFRHVKRNEWVSLKKIQDDPTILERIDWLYKNGRGQFTVRDVDHGTTREWGDRVLGAYIQKESK
jgi:hypothetical protein